MKARLKELLKAWELLSVIGVALLLAGSAITFALFDIGAGDPPPPETIKLDPAFSFEEQATLRQAIEDVRLGVEELTGRKTLYGRIYLYRSRKGLEDAMDIEGRPRGPLFGLIPFVTSGTRTDTLLGHDLYIDFGVPGSEEPAVRYQTLARAYFNLYRYDASNAYSNTNIPYWLSAGMTEYFANQVQRVRFPEAAEAGRRQWQADAAKVYVGLATLSGRAAPATLEPAAARALAIASAEFFASRLGDATMLKFWTELGVGDGWEAALKRSFGFDANTAYAQFDASRGVQSASAAR